MPELTNDQRKDYDETRRLLYMALCAPLTKRYNLAGTLVNALLHHSKVYQDRDALIVDVCDAVDGAAEDLAWILEQIDEITAKLDAVPES
jgi:hypothetical protein